MPDDKQPLRTTNTLSLQLDVAFALEAAGLGVWELDPVTRLINWDERCRRLFGLASGRQLSHQEAIVFVHPDDADRVDRAVQWALTPQSGGHYDVTYRTIGADDGQLRWVRFIGKGYFHPDGQIYRFAGVAQEVTPQMEAQLALQESEQRFRLLADALPQAIWVADPTGKFEFLNKWWIDYSGVSVEPSTVWQVANDSVHPEDMPRLIDTFQQAIQQEKGFSIEHRNRSASGEYQWFLNVGEPYRDPQTGQVTKWVGMSVNIDELKRAEKALKHSEASFRLLIKEAPLATSLFVGRELRVAVANEPMLAIWGKGPGQVGRTLAEILPEIANQPFLAILDNVYTTGQTYSAKGGRADLVIDGVLGTYYFDFTYKPLLDASGQVYAILQMAADVTEQVVSQQALDQLRADMQTQLEGLVEQRTHELRLLNDDLQRSNDNLQQFAYVASHDLQEPLRKIQSFGSLLEEHLGERADEQTRNYLSRMTSAGARMSLLIRDLLNYSRIATRQQSYGLVSLDAVLAGVLDTLSLDIEQRQAQLRLADLPVVNGDLSQLSQLFQNLVSNALKFTPMGQPPRIRIDYSQRQATELPPEVQPARSASHYHQINVSDEGVGFDTKYLDRIFHVFQRLHTQRDFAGTGVGLAICLRVVENHGGVITANSRPGEGATFSVYLPA